MRAPATVACERSRTTPRIDPVTSARSRFGIKSITKASKRAETTCLNRFCIRHPQVGVACHETLEAIKPVAHLAVFDTACLSRTTNMSVITDRKSTRLNSSHSQISYAVFCLKNKRLLCCPRLSYY